MLFLSCHFAGENHLSFCDLTEELLSGGFYPFDCRIRKSGGSK